MLRRPAAFLVVAVLAVLAMPGLAHAATITVNSTADNFDQPGECTLRDAIESAITDSSYTTCAAGDGDDTIVFALPAPSTITLAAGEVVLPAEVEGNDIDIQGPGADRLTISGGGLSRVFFVEGGNPLGASDAISGLTIAGGMSLSGAGVFNKGDLTLTGVMVTGNEAAETAAGTVTAGGGGIANDGGALTLADSTVAGNTAAAISTSGPGVATARGGGIDNAGSLTIADSTIAANVVIAGGPEAVDPTGGGIVSEVGDASVTSSTVVDNIAISGSGTGLPTGANVAAGSGTTFENTIVADPEGAADCAAPVTSLGFNLEDEDSCGFGQPTDLPETDPLLAAAGLADNGGPTPTIALEPGSPALDQGLAAPGETTDQRGLTRPVALPGLTAPPGGDHADIGAYEQQLPEKSEPTEPTHPGGGEPSDGGGGGGGGTPASGGGPQPAQASARKPKVTIAHLPAKTSRRRVTIRFHADLPGATFRCALDGARPRPCRSPFRTPGLDLGRHTFTVLATAGGQTGRPAKVSFRVVRRRSGR